MKYFNFRFKLDQHEGQFSRGVNYFVFNKMLL